MTRAAEIAADPAWLPHRIDVATRQVEFIRVPRATLAERGFLADRNPPASERALVGWEDLQGMQVPTGQLHFIFHTAFCRSTLLVRALDAPGVAAGLNEPGIIASLVNAGDAAAPLLNPLLALLARPHAPGEVMVVKPTNHANRLIPALLRARPDSRAILMSNDLPVFLRSVARKGLMGRNWGRKLFLELQGYAGMDFGMDPRESFAMTDMQAAGLAWLLNQRFFALHLGGQVPGIAPERLRLLDGDRFDAAREETLAAVLDHFGAALPAGLPAMLAEGPVFAQHAKLGGDFAGDDTGGIDPRLEEEIGQVGQWVGLIAQQGGLDLPLPQTLL